VQNLEIVTATEQGRQRQWQRPTTPVFENGDMSSHPAAREERVAGCVAEIERRRQRPHRICVRSPAFPSLQRADGVDRETCHGRKLLLCETCCFAKRLQPRPK
jgi:hypothetical protein